MLTLTGSSTIFPIFDEDEIAHWMLPVRFTACVWPTCVRPQEQAARLLRCFRRAECSALGRGKGARARTHAWL